MPRAIVTRARTNAAHGRLAAAGRCCIGATRPRTALALVAMRTVLVSEAICIPAHSVQSVAASWHVDWTAAQQREPQMSSHTSIYVYEYTSIATPAPDPRSQKKSVTRLTTDTTQTPAAS